MTAPSPARNALALALTTAEALRLAVGEAEPFAALVEQTDLVVIGLPDEVSAPASVSADATVLISALASRFPTARWLATASFARDFPYNIARRIASADALAPGRVGLALVAAETTLPVRREGTPEELLVDGVAAIRKLWESWPLDSVVADRERRLFVESESIRLALHENLWQVRGPLQVPVDADEIPPIAVWGSGPVVGADALITGLSASNRVALLDAEESGFGGIEGAGGAAGSGANAETAASAAAFTRAEAAIGSYIAQGWQRSPGASLRTALGLGAPERVLTAAAPAFEGQSRIQ